MWFSASLLPAPGPLDRGVSKLTQTVNSQVLRYAGYQLPGGGILGDPANAALTKLAHSLGWQGTGSRFDLLPLIVRGGDGRLHAFDIPADAVLEVPIFHPDHDWLAGLVIRGEVAGFLTGSLGAVLVSMHPMAPVMVLARARGILM